MATVVIIGVVAVLLAVADTNSATKIVSAVTALVGIGGLGLGIWTNLPGSSAGPLDVSGRWTKVTQSGNRFGMVLEQDGTLTEWRIGDESETWGGTWTWRKTGGMDELQITIGPYEARLRQSGAQFRGEEHSKDGVHWVTLSRP
ncbi:hypothetical protein ACRYCC_30625 [Actinomadura scrupuli]|uniref:hypothetical protein n=1 Tax=Actinomadura scrupuli TaxID=559629 RepID=UPI003D98D3C0